MSAETKLRRSQKMRGKLSLYFLAFLAFSTRDIVECEKGPKPTFFETLRSNVVKGALKQTATSIAKHGAFRFMRDVESNALKDLINKVEFDNMQREEEEKVLRAAWMVEATDKLYFYDYACNMDNENMIMNISISVGQDVDLKKKWILDYFRFERTTPKY